MRQGEFLRTRWVTGATVARRRGSKGELQVAIARLIVAMFLFGEEGGTSSNLSGKWGMGDGLRLYTAHIALNIKERYS